jgi:hypothetical protein
MTLRIHRAVNNDVVVLTISGDIAAGDASELRALLDADADLARRVLLDLKDLAAVDRAGVLVLAGCEASRATLANCPGYVREWIAIGINGHSEGGHHDRDRDRATQRASS